MGELVDLLGLFPWCIVTVLVLSLFITAPWVGLQCVIVAFSDQTYSLIFCIVALRLDLV